ncbi:PAS domain-containing protein [Flavonifractor plautii]|nr:PAS domain-containing protein [Flavonifractor plautii]
MDREEAFEFLDRTARGIAEMFGSTCETLVHDMGTPATPSCPSTTGTSPAGPWAPPWTSWAPPRSWTRTLW